MLIANGDGTYIGGPLDVWCILHNVKEGTYHAAFFEEKPMPGPVPDWQDVKVVRLKSKMHHTEGVPTLEEALAQLDEVVPKVEVHPENVWRDPKPWDGEIGIVWAVPNWRIAQDGQEPSPISLTVSVE